MPGTSAKMKAHTKGTRRRDSYTYIETRHTEETERPDYGELRFNGYGRTTSKYIRVDHHTDMKQMKDTLYNHWKLPPPRLMISVTGGAQDFEIEERLKEVFSQSLMKAAGNTGAWIITGGMYAGVMKHVGEAVKQHITTHGRKDPVIILGITPWGAVRDKEDLTNKKGKGDHQPTEHKVIGGDAKMCSLDPNHSHFILVDDGTEHQYGTEIKFRTKLESHISDNKDDSDATKEDTAYVPRVCLVLEGGEGTLVTVENALKNQTPVIIVEGTGRIADVLAFAYANSEKDEDEFRKM